MIYQQVISYHTMTSFSQMQVQNASRVTLVSNLDYTLENISSSAQQEETVTMQERFPNRNAGTSVVLYDFPNCASGLLQL